MVAGLLCGVVQPFASTESARMGLSLTAFVVILAASTLVCAPTVGMPLWYSSIRRALLFQRRPAVTIHTI